MQSPVMCLIKILNMMKIWLGFICHIGHSLRYLMNPERTHTYDTGSVGDSTQCIAMRNSSLWNLSYRQEWLPYLSCNSSLCVNLVHYKNICANEHRCEHTGWGTSLPLTDITNVLPKHECLDIKLLQKQFCLFSSFVLKSSLQGEIQCHHPCFLAKKKSGGKKKQDNLPIIISSPTSARLCWAHCFLAVSPWTSMSPC